MRSQLAKHFETVRREKDLPLSRVARAVGYKNISKGSNRISKFERFGEIPGELLEKLAQVIGIEESTIDVLIEEDRQAFLKSWKEWVAQPIRPYVVIRWIPAVYQSVELPAGTITLEQGESFAAERARAVQKRACLVWSRKLSVWFDECGNVTSRTEASPGAANVPFMRLRAGLRNFVLSHDAVGGTMLRIINWPRQSGRT